MFLQLQSSILKPNILNDISNYAKSKRLRKLKIKKSIIGKMVLILVPEINPENLISGLGKATDPLDDLNQDKCQKNAQ
jgi:hypothetical protein